MLKHHKARIIEAKNKWYQVNKPELVAPCYAYPNGMKFHDYENTDTTSGGLEKCIRDFLNWSGHHGKIIKNQGRQIDNTEVVKDVLGNTKVIGSKYYISGSGTNGTPDVEATIAPLGLTWGIEVKMEYKKGKDKMSDAQKKYRPASEAAGALYSTVSSFEEFLNQYDDVIAGLKDRVAKLAKMYGV